MQLPSPLGQNPSTPSPQLYGSAAAIDSFINVEKAPYNARASDTGVHAIIQRAIDDCAAAGGGIVYLPRLYTFRSGITLPSSVKLYGGGIGGGGIRAFANLNINFLIRTDSAIGAAIEGLELDGNADNLGCQYLVFGIGTTRMSIKGCYVHDSYAAGFEDLDGWYTEVLNNQFLRCGRNAVAENHAIVVGSTSARGCLSPRVEGNNVDTAFRKGITVFAFTPGFTRAASIVGNTAQNCGLGGIYIGGDVATTIVGAVVTVGNTSGYTVTGNTLTANVNNMVVERLAFSSVLSNPNSGSVGGVGATLTECVGVTYNGNATFNSGANSIRLLSCISCIITENPCINANSSNGVGIGNITVSNSTGCIVSKNIALDPSGKVAYAILEDGTSDNNVFNGNIAAGGTIATYLILGPNSLVDATSGRNRGIGNTTPANTLDITGGISLRENGLALAAGNNNDVALPANSGFVYLTAPAAAVITGVAGGGNGRQVTFINLSGFNITIANNSGLSLAANRILNGTGAGVVLPTFGAATIGYSPSAPNLWVMLAKA